MDKPTDEEISKAVRHSIKHRAASPVLYEAFDVFYRYRAWADGELELANSGNLRYRYDQAVRERSFLCQQRDEANEKIRVLLADVAKGQYEFERRLKAKDAKIIEIQEALSDSEDALARVRQENERLTTNLVDARQRDLAKGAEITRIREENERLIRQYVVGRKWSATAPPQWVPEPSVPATNVELEAAIASLPGEQPKGKSYADAELGVIQDCLEALNRIPANQRAAVTQYLTSRAHTAAWGAIPQQQAVPPW